MRQQNLQCIENFMKKPDLKNDVLIIGRTKEWLKYELPKKYQRTNNQLCWSKQIWFLLKLATDEAFINLNVSKT